MNSEKAAAVRDSVNACPTVASEKDYTDRDGSDPLEKYTGETLTGDCFTPRRSFYRPAYVEQSGTFGDGDGRTTPVFVVVLKALWTERRDVRSLSSELVHEVAKHGCRIRFYPPGHRLEGDIWIVDNFAKQDLPDADGERCSECEGAYFKVRDGTPECARCGTAKETEQTTLVEGA